MGNPEEVQRCSLVWISIKKLQMQSLCKLSSHGKNQFFTFGLFYVVNLMTLRKLFLLAACDQNHAMYLHKWIGNLGLSKLLMFMMTFYGRFCSGTTNMGSLQVDRA